MEAGSCVFQTALGWVGITSSAIGLSRLILPMSSSREVNKQLGETMVTERPVPDGLKDVAERLRAYFKGYKIAFADDVDLTGATDFQRRVWETTRRIPYGETRSYRWVAEHTGNFKSVRATGQALGDNPLPIVIPCHRVLRRDGGMGGYAGGLELKRYLLWLEAVAFMRLSPG
jgi:methylated-DNA-[protein]-cysteine S-methyltransferase